MLFQGFGGGILLYNNTDFLGSACEEEIPDLLEYDLTPTVGSTEFLTAWVAQIRQNREHCPGNILSPFEVNILQHISRYLQKRLRPCLVTDADSVSYGAV